MVRIDFVGRQLTAVDGVCKPTDSFSKLPFATEANRDLDRLVDRFGVTGRANCKPTWRTEFAEFTFERRNNGFVEDAHRDSDPVGIILEGPLKKCRQRLVGTLFEQISFGYDDGDMPWRFLEVTAESNGEIRIVQHYQHINGERLKTPLSPARIRFRDVGTVKCVSEISFAVTDRLRRAGGFAAVASLALAAPVLGPSTTILFGVIGLAAAFVISDGPLFELFARPGDFEDSRLNGLAGFSLAAAALALLATVPESPLPVDVFVGTLYILGFGNFGMEAVRRWTTEPFVTVAGFVAAGFAAGIAGQYLVGLQLGTAVDVSAVTFLSIVGALIAALLRELLYERDDPLVLLSVGLVLWLFTELVETVPPVELVAALAVTVILGGISYGLGTASVSGMLTGVLLGVLTIVLGGFGWFAVLIAFFAIGGLASKFRYSDKAQRGVAEGNDGARGSGNVLANAAVAFGAVFGFAVVDPASTLGVAFVFVFCGSLATALGDTLSSEIGGLFDNPRLITTFERVEPGTDGAVTWQGELAGIVGAILTGLLSMAVLPLSAMWSAAAIIAGGGLVGMTVDSLLGATLEGGRLGNQWVNFLATLSGGLASGALAVVVL